MFAIVTYQGPHTCFFDNSNENHPQLDTNIIANEILSLVRADPSLKIKVIVEAVKKSYQKYRVTYYKAWYGKQKAISIIFGDWDESYRRLPKFLGAIQKYNPGTIVKWSTSDFINPDNTINPNKVIFRRVFWAFKASIDGFKHCRPFISIDATFLYGKYKGKILIAMTKDGNNQLFPIAFAIVDEESKSNWGWFLYSLRHNVIGDRPDICLISDRHKGIIAAVNDRRYGWTDHHHRYCLRHVRSNFNSKFQNSVLKDLVWEAGSTTQIRIFDQAMEKIKNINQNAWEYLNNIPAKQWTLCHDGGYRFGETTSNMVESYNGVLKEGRNLPITACVQVIFFKVVKYFEERRRFALQMSTNGLTITSSAFLMWELNDNLSSTHNVEIFDRAKGEANVYSKRGNYYAVVLSKHTCTCGRWETYRIPCSHAIKVCKTLARSSKNLISNWYSLSTYAQIWAPELHPLHHEEYWDEPDCPIWIPDHNLRRDKGRPRSTRIHNEMDIPKGRVTACCGICGQAGHDRRRCPAREGQSSGARRLH